MWNERETAFYERMKERKINVISKRIVGIEEKPWMKKA